MVRDGALSTPAPPTHCQWHRQLAFLPVSDPIAARDRERLREVEGKREQKILLMFRVLKPKMNTSVPTTFSRADGLNGQAKLGKSVKYIPTGTDGTMASREVIWQHLMRLFLSCLLRFTSCSTITM